MRRARQLAIRRQIAQASFFEDPAGILAEVAKRFPLEDKDHAVDQIAQRLRFLVELDHPAGLNRNFAETARRRRAGHRGQFGVAMVELKQRGDVDAAPPIAAGQQELATFEVFSHQFHPCAGHRILTCVCEGERPMLLDVSVVEDWCPVVTDLEREIVPVLTVTEKITLDNLAFLVQTQDKLVVLGVGIALHHVPKDRVIPDRHHGFGPVFGFFADPRALVPAQDDEVHGRFIVNRVKKSKSNSRRYGASMAELLVRQLDVF